MRRKHLQPLLRKLYSSIYICLTQRERNLREKERGWIDMWRERDREMLNSKR